MNLIYHWYWLLIKLPKLSSEVRQYYTTNLYQPSLPHGSDYAILNYYAQTDLPLHLFQALFGNDIILSHDLDFHWQRGQPSARALKSMCQKRILISLSHEMLFVMSFILRPLHFQQCTFTFCITSAFGIALLSVL